MGGPYIHTSPPSRSTEDHGESLSMNTVTDLWNSYYLAIHPPGVRRISQEQFDETKKAFYAGMAAMFHAIVVASGDLPEDEAIKYIGELDKGLSDYIEDFKRRHAASLN